MGSVQLLEGRDDACKQGDVASVLGVDNEVAGSLQHTDTAQLQDVMSAR